MGRCASSPLCALRDEISTGNNGPCTVSGGYHSTVDLAISELPVSREWMMAGQVMYHTSVIVQGFEFFFGKDGLQSLKLAERFGTPASHENKARVMVFEVGHTRKNSDELMRVLQPYFSRDSYDLVRKNCNSFTDCALAFLLSRRLPKKYSVSENLGKEMPSIVSLVTGQYLPNPKANEFKLESVVLRIDPNAWMGTATQLPVFKDAPQTPKGASL